jgi:hypothetical protein
MPRVSKRNAPQKRAKVVTKKDAKKDKAKDLDELAQRAYPSLKGVRFVVSPVNRTASVTSTYTYEDGLKVSHVVALIFHHSHAGKALEAALKVIADAPRNR